MTNSTRHLLAAIALNATVLASCSASAQEPAATEPLEVKLVGVDECAAGGPSFSATMGDDLLPASERPPRSVLDR